jgi:hypothetical protein
MSKQLRRHYQKLNSRVGVQGVCLGLTVTFLIAVVLSCSLEVDPNLPWTQQYHWKTLVFTVLVVPLFAIYGSYVFMARRSISKLVAHGEMTPAEARRFTYLSVCPPSWYQDPQ